MLIKKENQILIHFDQSQLKSSVSEYRFQQPRLVVFYPVNKLLKKIQKEVKEAVRDQKVLGKPLPENIEKLVSFMDEVPGSTIEDYVRLNADYSNVDNDTLLREYYKQAKSHLDSSEINFMIEDNFSFDEEVDEEREIRKKKLAYKEEVAKARKHLDGLKSQYYEEIKLRPGTTQDQQKAMDFFNRYNEAVSYTHLTLPTIYSV